MNDHVNIYIKTARSYILLAKLLKSEVYEIKAQKCLDEARRLLNIEKTITFKLKIVS